MRFQPARLFVLMLTLVVLSACSSKAEKTRKTQAELYFGAGTQSLMTQDYTDALANLLKANEMDPDNADIINNLGMAYYFKGEKTMAIKALRRSIELKENPDAKNNLASIYYQDGNHAMAEKMYKSVLKDLTYGKQARVLYNLAVIELDRKNVSAAEHYLKRAVKEEENYCAAYFQLGKIRFNRKEYSTALNNFKDATMGTCYESAGAHYYQGLTLSALNRTHEAMMKFDEIDARFKETEFAAKARAKISEITRHDSTNTPVDFHASRKKYGAQEF